MAESGALSTKTWQEKHGSMLVDEPKMDASCYGTYPGELLLRKCESDMF